MKFFLLLSVIATIVGVGYFAFIMGQNTQNQVVIDETDALEVTEPDETQEVESLLTFEVGLDMVGCVGEAQMECLVVNGEYFYDSIEGFTFVPGYEYTLSVRRTARENVPMDASAYTYELVEVIEQVSVQTLEASAALVGTTWQWIETQYIAQDNVEAVAPEMFELSFEADGVFSATTDCNNARGTYTTNADSLSFGQMVATKMACMDSQENEYVAMLAEVEAFEIDAQDNLVLTLADEAGQMIYVPVTE